MQARNLFEKGKGIYIYRLPRAGVEKYSAYVHFTDGRRQSKVFYDLEEAKSWCLSCLTQEEKTFRGLQNEFEVEIITDENLELVYERK